MATSKATKTAKVSQVLTSGSLTKKQVDEMIEKGLIREEYLSLTEGFDNDYTVTEAPSQEINAFKGGGKIEVPKYVFDNDNRRVVVWGTTLLNSLVFDKDKIKTAKIVKAGNLPVYFRDEFNAEFPALRRIADGRDEDGGIPIYNWYQIQAATVLRSKVDPTRWDVSYQMYEKGISFLEFEKVTTNNSKLVWIPESRIVEISKLDVADRTFTGASGKIVLPGFNELKIMANADTDIRWAKAQFVINKTWK